MTAMSVDTYDLMQQQDMDQAKVPAKEKIASFQNG